MRTTHFKYLNFHIKTVVSQIFCKMSRGCDVAHQINTTWMQWGNISGVLCDKKMAMTTKKNVSEASKAHAAWK